MLRSILVPLDGSMLAERALSYATALSIPTGARLVLVRAAVAHTLPGIDARASQSKAVDDAERYLAVTAASLKKRGFECDTALPYGGAAEWLPQEASLHRADLIVMSTHGRTGPGRWVFGSVTESVVASSPVPVLVERAWQPVRRDVLLSAAPIILLPLDGSPLSEAGLGPAASLAEDLGAELILLHVEAKPTDVIADEIGRAVVYLDRQEEWSRSDALGYLEGVANHLAEQHPGVAIQTQALLGDAVECIAQATESTGAALVFMTTHGRTGIRRTILGSVAGKVLERGDVPLVLCGPKFDATHIEGTTDRAVA